MTTEKDQDATEFALNIRRPYKKVLEEAIAKDKKLGSKKSITSFEDNYQENENTSDYRSDYDNTYTRKLITIHTGDHNNVEEKEIKEYLTLQIMPEEALFKLDDNFLYIEDNSALVDHRGRGASKEISMITGTFSMDSLKELRDFLNYALPSDK
ncbi:MAG: hypothetical protein HFP81_08560 [Methylococcales symbiont of Hymedesmia sp. n. MRB-2018]|nr:MAG: hypothetical protein HFP78_08790 [Methylococcales symbiont of Hymedesmia sp. n. MRB-2018]KAF3983223.1 MAG: hypothetical protein HFP81_08560 [Methylococcales symbiont of Hymedesmia sp. n. MRB-2018]